MIATEQSGGPRDLLRSITIQNSAKKSRLAVIKQHLINAWAHSIAAGRPGARPAIDTYRSAIEPINILWRMFYPDSSQEFGVAPAGPDPDEGFDVFLFGPGE